MSTLKVFTELNLSRSPFTRVNPSTVFERNEIHRKTHQAHLEWTFQESMGNKIEFV